MELPSLLIAGLLLICCVKLMVSLLFEGLSKVAFTLFEDKESATLN
jgi:hypothetical protein